MLRLHDLEKRFGARTLFRGVSLALAPGERVAVLGESGCGKSTLLNIVAGLEPADAGRVEFDGATLDAADDAACARLRRESLGFVFQAFHVLPHLDALANAALPLLLRGLPRAEAQARARDALADVGLAARTHARPRELSGGELQRVAIARALAGAPRLVLADEPTGNLDADNARQVLDLLRAQAAARGAALVLVTHSEAAAATCERRLRLGPDGLAAF